MSATYSLAKDIRLKADDIDAWIESKPYVPQRAS